MFFFKLKKGKNKVFKCVLIKFKAQNSNVIREKKNQSNMYIHEILKSRIGFWMQFAGKASSN